MWRVVANILNKVFADSKQRVVLQVGDWARG